MLARCGECCNAKDNASRCVAENVARCSECCNAKDNAARCTGNAREMRWR